MYIYVCVCVCVVVYLNEQEFRERVMYNDDEVILPCIDAFFLFGLPRSPVEINGALPGFGHFFAA